jgi:glycosyltransferase involved in cell wall biosynthesis
MPSRREGLPLALLEALAAGCAVVATSVGGIPEVVGQEGEAALLVQPEDPEALADAMGRLFADGDLRRRLGRAGRERVHREFSRQRMTEGVAALYHRWVVPEPGDRTAHLDSELE